MPTKKRPMSPEQAPRRKQLRLGFNLTVDKSVAITTPLKKKKPGPKPSQSRSSASHAVVGPAPGTSGILAVEEEDVMASPESQRPDDTVQPDDQIVHRKKPRVTVDTLPAEARKCDFLTDVCPMWSKPDLFM
jgi:hypothetical protein